MALARPDHWRLAFGDTQPDSALTLALPARRMWPAGLIVGVMFAIFAGVWFSVYASFAEMRPLRDMFDLAFVLFQLAWLVGWTVGTVILGLLAVLLLFYREAAWLDTHALVYAPQLGPLRFVGEYALAGIRNLRAEAAGDGRVRLCFDYRDGERRLGDLMPRAQAERLIAMIHSRAPAATAAPADLPAAPVTPEVAPVPPVVRKPLPLTAPSSLVLIAANLLPLAGVLTGQLTLGQVMVLFWSESAIIGFFTLLKMVIVGKWAVLAAGPFFVSHYGGFMAIHFLFVYGLFAGGFATSTALPALEALAALYRPLWPAAAALFVSHAVSFALNFIGRGEYRSETMSGLMAAPYARIIVMHLTIIVGGWIAMLAGSNAPALALLIGLKLVADLRGHRHEHGGAT